MAARAGAGRSVVAVDVRESALPLRPSDRVTLLLTPDGAADAVVVARRLEVLERSSSRVSVAVPDALLARVTGALSTGVVTLALEGG